MEARGGVSWRFFASARVSSPSMNGMEQQGREALKATLAAIDAKEWQRAGEIALGGVAHPLRLEGEALADLLERFAKPLEDARHWRDEVVRALETAIPLVLDAALALYANVLFHRLVKPREEPLFDLDVPPNGAIDALAEKEIEERTREVATDHYAHAAANEAAKLVETTVKVAELWASCATDAEKLAPFYESAEAAAQEMLATSKTLRISIAV